MRRHLSLVCILATSLAGCTTYHAKPITSAQLTQQFEARSLISDDLRTFMSHALGHDAGPWPPQRWNREMLTLAADYYSPTLKVARAQWHTAKAGVVAAGAVPNPALQLPFQYSKPNPGPGSPYTTGPALDLLIETAHKRTYRVDEARHQSDAARLSLRAAAWQVSAQVRNALLSIYAARQQISILARKADAEHQIVEMVTKRRAVGESSGPDVGAAELAALQTQAALGSARNSEQDAYALLAHTIGIPPDALHGISLDLRAFKTLPPAPISADARHDAIFHRADLLASLAQYAGAESALQLEVAKQYPDIHLGPGYTYDTGTQKISFGLASMSLPIFDQNQGGIAQARAKRDEAAARTEALQDTILGNLAHALTSYQTRLDALQVAFRHLELARQQLDTQTADFAAGSTDRLALMQDRASHQASELTHLDAVVAAQQAAGTLEDALQLPLGLPAANTKPTRPEGNTP